MRLFYAIEFENDVKEYIKRFQDTIKNNSLRGNFSHKENFHLTLKFIGEVEEEKLTEIKNSLDRAVNKIEPFAIKFERLGVFTKADKKIVWIGIINEDELLNSLYDSLEAALSDKGFPKESKGYSPHITLSRETVFKAGFEEQLKRIKIDPMEIKINKVSLMESTRVNGKLTYRAIYVKEL